MPDLELLVNTYQKSTDASASIEFLEASLLGIKKRERNFIGLLRFLFGNSRHLWLWDYKSAKKELELCGFNNIRKAHYGDASDETFIDVENVDRWKNCLGIECIK